MKEVVWILKRKKGNSDWIVPTFFDEKQKKILKLVAARSECERDGDRTLPPRRRDIADGRLTNGVPVKHLTTSTFTSLKCPERVLFWRVSAGELGRPPTISC
ncbi:hypothetical protein EVAR_102609_1 [Eumeta japonica]|uniref:Uncharacterized protein n=1 Tax=Eumeta variegata TaxID=151549 RepID=A0A4C1TUP8_EUMVA|nr:hypothetical protein EVAR_102609_1 [Eumeta japonica]